MIDSSEIFMDSTHIKATANHYKYMNQKIDAQVKFMSGKLKREIDLDRKKHAKKVVKSAIKSETEAKKVSTTNPESNWFHKGRTQRRPSLQCPSHL